jgi:glutamate/tyrosine decarboxylase-like PLP-dependent enzyme
MCGLGREAMREVPVDDDLRMKPETLASMIAEDRAAGYLPFLVIASAGTTNAGAVDPIAELANIAEAEALWLHVDAAWGGAAVLDPSLAPLLDGCGRADSITFDAHKWLSVPMGAGLFLTRHPNVLDRTFRTITAYMPKEAAGLDVVDPHLHSMQWSRRFTGLKVFLSLAVAGWQGYSEAIRHMTAMGDHLRVLLTENGWDVVNRTRLPVVCFVDRGGADPATLVSRVVSSGEAWISTTVLANSRAALRACITNYRTGEGDLRALVESLNRAR